jgi:hypothetical protein
LLVLVDESNPSLKQANLLEWTKRMALVALRTFFDSATRLSSRSKALGS